MNKTWNDYYCDCIKYDNLSKESLDNAIKLLARDKGFSEEQITKFDADLCTGGEAVVKYDWGGEMNDITLREMSGMTKEEIIKAFNME